GEEIVGRAGGQVPTDSLDRGGDLLRGTCRGALGEELRRQLGETLLAGRGVDGPRPEREAHGYDGLLVALDHDEGEPVGERRLVERREANRREAGGFGRGRRETLAAQADRRTGGQKNPRHHREDGPPVRPAARPPAHWAEIRRAACAG